MTPPARTLWLVGMMGSGKSTVGERLASRLACSFVDTDRVIEEGAGVPVAEIFARDGEEAFRARERAAIARHAGQRAVVALGGGAMAQPGAPETLATSGTTIYLRALPETLRARLADDETRPLLAGLSATARAQRLVELLRIRSSQYERAAVVIDTDGIDADEVVRRILARLGDGS